MSDTTLSSNGSMGKRLPKAPVSSARKLTNVGKTKTGFRENSNIFSRALHQNPGGSFIQKVDALIKHSRFCEPVSVALFPFHFPAIVLELSSRTHTVPQLPTQACPHTTPTVNVSSLPYLTCRLHLPFTACIANTAEGPWNRRSWEPTHCSNQEQQVLLHFKSKCEIKKPTKFSFLFYISAFCRRVQLTK